MINLCRMMYLVFSFLSFSVCAQTSFLPTSKILQWQSKKLVAYKSAARQGLDEIRERTDVGYYAKRFKAQSYSADPKGFALRTAVACDISCISTSPLPVALISFTAQRTDASQVMLNWETSSETNNAGFDIERSLTTSNFEKVGFVDGRGSTTSTKAYQFTDRNSNEEITYYRLKQLDFDGKFEYSRIVAAAGFKEILSLVSVPNPGSQRSSFLQVKGNDKSGKIQLTIVDLKGALIYKNDQFLLGNNKQIPLSTLPELTTGLYIAKIVSGDQRLTVSFVVAER